MRKCYLATVALFAVFMAGCVAIQPFPYAVRAGDTITLAIGSLDGVNSSNVTVVWVPDSDPLNPVDVTSGIRSVFNIYPDKKSKSYWDDTSGYGLETIGSVEQLTGHAAWQTVVALDLPAAPTIQPGTGHFKVTVGSGVVSPNIITKADDVNIDAEILNGAGSPHVFEYRKYAFNTTTSIGQLNNLEQLRQVVIRTVPDSSTTAVPVAAAEYNLFVPVVDTSLTDVSNTVPDSDLAIILDDKVSYDRNQTSLEWSRTGSTVKVITTSLSGNQNANMLRFSVVLSNYATAETNGWKLGDTAGLVSVKYFDSNGNEITGPTPEVLVQ